MNRHEAGNVTELTYLAAFRDDPDWVDAARARLARIEAGKLAPRLRELVFVTCYLINRYPEATRLHKQRAQLHGATADDFRLILKILDFYRGLRVFQDAQKVLSFWRSGVFPIVKPAEHGSIDEIFQSVMETRKYIANGFRVYSADGEWLRLYLRRSDAIRRSPRTIDDGAVQLLSMAITLKNHRYSGNWNDGCIEVHEDKARGLGASAEEVLEVVQIMELCDSMTTAWEGLALLELDDSMDE